MADYSAIDKTHKLIISVNETDLQKLNRLKMEYHISNLKRLTFESADYYQNYKTVKEELQEITLLEQKINNDIAADNQRAAAKKKELKELEISIVKDIAAELNKIHTNL